MDICENLDTIKKKISAACKSSGRYDKELILIAVSKTQPVEAIIKALECGQCHFGENKVQELTEKAETLGNKNKLEWHMIGVLQTNKIKYLINRASWIHSISKIKHLKEIEKRAATFGIRMNVLLQINISDEKQKSGFAPDDLKKVLSYAQNMKWTKVHGLMGMASYAEDVNKIRLEFRFLRELRDSHKGFETEILKMHHLSMGMTSDLEIAIEEGATMVRVGTAIFGNRQRII